MLQLTFNPGLTLTGFRTTRPWLSQSEYNQIVPFSHQQFLWDACITSILLQIDEERSWLYESLSDPLMTMHQRWASSTLQNRTKYGFCYKHKVLSHKVRSWSSKHRGWRGTVNGKPSTLHVISSPSANALCRHGLTYQQVIILKRFTLVTRRPYWIWRMYFRHEVEAMRFAAIIKSCQTKIISVCPDVPLCSK